MKANLSRMLRSGIALLLVFCMVAGFLPTTAFAATSKPAGDGFTTGSSKKYVSLGDSMTNGYGLDGYYYGVNNNVWGFLQEAPNAYPTKVANHYGWDLTQLALSGFRAEEVHYLLTYGSENAYPGDDYTHRAGLQRFDDNDIQSIWPNYAGVANMAKLFQDSIMEADVVSIQLGTNNFGTFMTQRLCYMLSNITGFSFGGTYYETDLNEQLDLVAPEAAEFGMDMYNKLLSLLTEQLAANGVSDQTLNDFCVSLTEAAVYSTIGFVNSYKGVIDWIDANSNAEVIAVAMPNSLEGMLVEVPVGEGNETTTLDMGEFFSYLVNTANAYITGLAAAYDVESQLNSDSAHNVKVYYADPGSLELLITQIATGNFEGYGVLEDRIVGNVVSTIFPLLKDAIDDVVENYGLALVNVDTAKVNTYKDFAEKWKTYIAAKTVEPNTTLTDSEIFSCAIYLAIEDAIVASAGMEKLDGNALAALVMNQLESVFASIQNALDPDDIIDMNEVSNFAQSKTTSYTQQLQTEASQQSGELYTAVLEYIRNNNLGTNDWQTAANAVISAKVKADVISTYPEKLFNAVLSNNEAKNVVAKYASRYAAAGVTDVLADALKENDTIMGLFHLFARYMIGDGIGCHPSINGHSVTTAAIIDAYDSNHTATDEVVENVNIVLDELYNLVQTYGPEAAEQVWAQWVEYGYVEAVETSIDELKGILTERYAYYTDTALPAIDASVKNLSAQKDALSTELAGLKTELEAKKAELANVIANAQIGDIYIPNISIDAELGGNVQTQVPENDCAVDGQDIQTELEAAVKDLEHAIAVIEALLADVEADIADMIALAEQIAAAVAELEKTMASLAQAAEDVEVAVNAVIEVVKNADGVVDATANSLKAARATANAALEILMVTAGTAEEMMADVDAMIEKIAADAETLYNKFITDLPGCLEQIPQEALVLLAPIMAAQQAYEANKEQIHATLTAELTKLAEEYGINENTVKAELDKLTKEYEANKTALLTELGAIEAEITAEVDAAYAEIKVEFDAQIEAAKTEANAKLSALNEELKSYQAELTENISAEARAQLQKQIDRVTADIATVKADLEHAVSHLENAAQEAYEQIVAEVTKVYKEAIAALNQKLNELKVAYDKAVAELNQKLAELKAAYDKAVQDLIDAADKLIADLNDALNKELEKINKALADEINGILDAIRKELAAAQKAVEEILKGNLAAIGELKDALVEMGLDAIADAVDALNDAVMALIKDASTADLVICDNFKYVAIGDGSAETESYVEKLTAALNAEAAEKGVDEIEMVNHAGVGNTVSAECENLSDIADADLITVGFSNVGFLHNAMAGEVTLDWAGLVGEENVTYVDDLMADVDAELNALTLTGTEFIDKSIQTKLSGLIEAAAYSAVQYAFELPELIGKIHDENPDALVIVVGMYNPLDGVVFTLGEGVPLDVGEYIDYLVDGVAVHGLAYSILIGNSIYVDAREVATINADKELEFLGDIVTDIWNIDDELIAFVEKLYPSAEGDDSVAAEIADALNITYVKCADNDKDHMCDTCGRELSKCADEDKDHKCDTCGKELSKCADEDKNHKCDTCGKELSKCADNNKDHKCDICGKELSKCADEDKNHKCDTCGKELSECADENKDHKCDTCGKVLTECDFKDGKCVICGAEDPNYQEPTEPDPTEPEPTEPEPTEPEPTEPEPTEPEPTEPEPTEPEPTEPEPTEPEPTEPKPTEPEPTEPKPTEPEPTEPKPTEPEPTEPKPTEPEPTEPKPTEPEPTEPEPTEPEPTEPEPTEPQPSEPEQEETVRIAGVDRYETSFLIANEMKEILGVEKFQNVVLASSASFADALSGSYLAAVKTAPIILAKAKYADRVCAYLNENLAAGATVYILGGEAAVAESVLDGITVEHTAVRLAGEDRYATNLEILKAASIEGKDLLVATGRDFADCLSASATGMPILLVNSKEGRHLSDAQKELLATVTGKIYILGGTSAVNETLEKEIKAATTADVTRVSGSNRYETSVSIAKTFLPDAKRAVVAYAGDYPDGLCGGPLAYVKGAALLLTKNDKEAVPAYMAQKNITSGYVLGGTKLISDETMEELF